MEVRLESSVSTKAASYTDMVANTAMRAQKIGGIGFGFGWESEVRESSLKKFEEREKEKSEEDEFTYLLCFCLVFCVRKKV